MVQTNQNARIHRVMDKYRHTFQDLEIALWELQGSSAASIARLTNLRRRSIRLDHPHTRHSDLDRAFWGTASGSTVWNKLSARPGEERVLGRLQSLKLERAGLTDYQLRQILESNPSIKDLRLQKCLALTEETFGFLAANGVAESFKVFEFTRNRSEHIDGRILGYIGELPNLRSLSLHGCHNIDSDLVSKLNEKEWHIPDLSLPHSPANCQALGQQGVCAD